jgi:hypothetical protein
VIDKEDLVALAGQWTEVEAPMLAAAVPHGTPIIVGSSWPSSSPLCTRGDCCLCGGSLSLAPLDLPVIASKPGIAMMCPECFVKLQEE